MASREFVHLHCHTHYSLLDGASKIPALVAKAKSHGMPALAITDHGNLYGAVEFLRECKAAGIKPIVGLEAYVAPGHRADRSSGGGNGGESSYHLTLLARTGEGLRNLMRLSSLSFLEGFYYKPRIDKEILERHSAGLICLSGCAAAEFSSHLLASRRREAEELCAWYQRVFGDENFYVEIQDNGVEIQHDCMRGAIDVAQRMGLPLVATSDAHYLNQDDAPAHDILLCINTGRTFDDPSRMRFDTDQFHVRSPEEMYAALPGHEEALAQTVRIANLVEENYESLGFGKRQFPSFQTPAGVNADEYLRELCVQGLRERYGEDPPAEAAERLEHELAIIARMGFSAYFLIVWDFVRFARERGIPSSARGSACGALVSYLLYLSHVDPLKYDLLFERFLDPNRSEAPDIDIDLCKERRYEVIEYVRQKYGAQNVAQIGTFGTLGAKAAIRDVGRVLGIQLARVEQVTKLVPQRLNISLDEAHAEEPRLRALVSEDPEIGKLFEYARKLEGTARNVSTHAAGVVIADQPLDALVPLQKLPNKDKEKESISTQWGMGDVEKAGLLKMDFLGLRNLTSLAAAVRLIEARLGSKFDLFALPLDDQETYELLQRGDAKGVFQLDGAGIRDLLVKMKPDCFNDIIALLALYRPGPLNGGMVDAYVNRKHGRERPSYEHAVMRDVLESTHGVMVYQEQVMRILNRLGGIELSVAYATIKAISKKKAEIINQGRSQFVEGATRQGLEREQATRIFDLIEFFGGYGFNKSHATAYALLAYQTAYLKAHFPTEFMAALLSSEMDGAEREKYFVEHIDDCRRMGITVLPPNANEGDVEFIPAGERRIHFGLGAIKGVGLKAVAEIARVRREGGPFTSLDDFCERVSPRLVSPSNIEILIKAGAFDFLGARRAQLLLALPRTVQHAQARQDDRRRGQKSLFDVFADNDPDDGGGAAPLPDVPEMSDAERLAEEKRALGFYMSAHPLARHEGALRAFGTHEARELASLPDRTEVTIGGIIANMVVRNVSKSRSGLTRMVKFTFEDLSGSAPAMLWPEEFDKFESLIQDDAIVFVKGTMNRSREPAELVVSRVIPIERASAELCRGVVVTLRKGVHDKETLARIDRVVRNNPGNLDLYIELTEVGRVKRALLKAGAGHRVRHDDMLIETLERALGEGNVRLLGRRGVAPSRAVQASEAVEIEPESEELALQESLSE